MPMGLFKRASREERFWQWFQSRSDRLFDLELDQPRVFDELSAALHKVEEGLTFEFGPVQDGKREFIVSADGIRDRFPAVRRLVEAAPSMPRWVVIPFRPPRDIEMTIEILGHQLGPDDIWFVAESDSGRVGLTLFVRGLGDHNRQELCGAGFLLLDNALGEFVVETQVGFIDWQVLPGDPPAGGLKPFRKIREVFDKEVH